MKNREDFGFWQKLILHIKIRLKGAGLSNVFEKFMVSTRNIYGSELLFMDYIYGIT